MPQKRLLMGVLQEVTPIIPRWWEYLSPFLWALRKTSAVEIDESGMTNNVLWRTKQYPFSEIESAKAAPSYWSALTPLSYLYLHFRSGKQYKLAFNKRNR